LLGAAAIAAASAAVPADGRVVLEATGTQPRVGQDFVVVANVSSAGASNPFSFTLRLTFAPGLQLVSWRNPFQPIACDRSGQTLTCRDRVIGGEITTNINLTLRAAAAGRYETSAALTVDDANDPNPANNTAQHFSEVLPAASSPTRRGTAGPDTLTGTAGNDRLFGLGGADLLRGLGGNDLLDGGAGNDRLFGGAGNDRLVGGSGVNRYSAGAGSDNVRAANGRVESVACGPGVDTAVLDRRDRATGCERITRR
jgi:Ca2+-binding RTX toxin-like protein